MAVRKSICVHRHCKCFNLDGHPTVRRSPSWAGLYLAIAGTFMSPQPMEEFHDYSLEVKVTMLIPIGLRTVLS